MLHPVTSLIASIPSPPVSWQILHLGPFQIRTYALCILAGIVAAWLITRRRLIDRGAEPGIELDVIIWAVPLGIVGARLYHVVTHPDDFFYAGANLWRVLFIWEGGNALFGSLIGGTIGAIIGCRWAKLRLWSFADALAPGLLTAQVIGRLGNYINHELYGLPTNAWWGLQIESTNQAFPAGLPDGTLFQPLFLFEMILNTVGVVFLFAMQRRFHLQWGKLFALYLIWYGVVRTLLETIRIDPSQYSFAGIPFNVLAASGAVVIGIVLFAVQTRRHPGVEPSVYLPGHEWHRPDPAADPDPDERDTPRSEWDADGRAIAAGENADADEEGTGVVDTADGTDDPAASVTSAAGARKR